MKEILSKIIDAQDALSEASARLSVVKKVIDQEDNLKGLGWVVQDVVLLLDAMGDHLETASEKTKDAMKVAA
jgi:hypothetical protein